MTGKAIAKNFKSKRSVAMCRGVVIYDVYALGLMKVASVPKQIVVCGVHP